LTVTGEVEVSRAYYHCSQCRAGHCPGDRTLGLETDALSPGVRPLVALAGALVSFEDGADDLLHRFANLRVSARTVWRVTARAGAEWRGRAGEGEVVIPCPAQAPWDFALADRTETVGYLGLDAFSVPMQQPDGTRADWRMLYLGVAYTPDKEGTVYVCDWDLDRVCERLRQVAIDRGFGRVGRVVAVTDAGNGLEGALKRHFDAELLCVLDWYHAVEHLHAYAGAAWPRDQPAAQAWVDRAKGVLYEQGGSALVAWVRGQELPGGADATEARRLLLGYFEGAAHRTEYPEYRAAGYDIGSGPTEAGCKVLGARLKGSGMRWTASGAVAVAALRAVYQSGPAFWDGLWKATTKRRTA
jgi:hypothetical protein